MDCSQQSWLQFNPNSIQHNHSLTKEVDHKAIVVAIDVGGWIWLKLNGDISHGGIELEVWPCAAVLAQDVRCQVITIVEGQQIILTNMETRTDQNKVGTFLPNETNADFHVKYRYKECPMLVDMWYVRHVFCSEL